VNWSFHPEAESEFLEAINYYEECRPGLGHAFAVEIYAAIERIVAYPLAWPILDGQIRRLQTNRFPYGVLYAQDADHIYILAVMHLHRQPGYWKGRVT